MTVFEAKVTSKGQLTVPVEIRDMFNIKPGDKVVFCTRQGGGLSLIVKNKTLAQVVGILGTPPKNAGLSIEDVDDVIAEALAEDDRRIRDDWSGHEHSSAVAGKRRPAAE
jgi:AbrB family looped-hinge helix DNA binding protein